MMHTLDLVRVVLKKNNYTGNAKVESVIWNGIYKQAKFNAVTNTITTTGEKGDYQAGGNFTVNDNEEPIIVEAILLPISTAEGVSVTISVDEKQEYISYLKITSGRQVKHIPIP